MAFPFFDVLLMKKNRQQQNKTIHNSLRIIFTLRHKQPVYGSDAPLAFGRLSRAKVEFSEVEILKEDFPERGVWR